MNSKITILLGFLLVMASCDSALEETYSKQADSIDAYVEKELEAHPEYSVSYNGGVVRMTVFKGDGPKLENDGNLTFMYAGYDFSSSSISSAKLLSTNIIDVAAAAGFDVSDETAFQPVSASLKKGELLEGLRLGLLGAEAGEDCYIFFTGKKAYGKSQVGMIPANSPLAFHIQVMSLNN